MPALSSGAAGSGSGIVHRAVGVGLTAAFGAVVAAVLVATVAKAVGMQDASLWCSKPRHNAVSRARSSFRAAQGGAG